LEKAIKIQPFITFIKKTRVFFIKVIKGCIFRFLLPKNPVLAENRPFGSIFGAKFIKKLGFFENWDLLINAFFGDRIAPCPRPIPLGQRKPKKSYGGFDSLFFPGKNPVRNRISGFLTFQALKFRARNPPRDFSEIPRKFNLWDFGLEIANFVLFENLS